ncbi:MAG TPA: hypothetical protein VIL36_06110, partial [Acidimicrobiales bacterium]
PVCGYPGLDEPAWVDDAPSYEICPCCGTEFGYQDVGHEAEARAARHRELRQEWIELGCPWWSNREPPPGWDPKAQLRNVDP